MPTYIIETPSGRKLKIEAPDQATALKGAQDWEAKNARPKQDKADYRPVTSAGMKATFGAPKKSSAWDQIGAFAQGAAEQLPFIDEAAAWTAGKITGKGYDATRKVQQQLSAEDRVERPLARNSGGVAGFTATVVAPVGAVGAAAKGGQAVSAGAKAASLGKATVKASALGAATGGVQGFASDDGSVAERMDGAQKGALLGGAIGAAAPALGRAGDTVMRSVNNMTGQRLVSPAASAAGRLRTTLEQDGVTGAALDRAVREFERVGAGAPALLDVAGENTRALLRYAASRTGPARNSAQLYRDTVTEGLPEAAQGRARALTPGETRPATQYADDLRTARDTTARTTYAEPYAQMVDVTPDMASAIRGEAGQAAIRRARAAAAARRDYGQVAELDQLLVGDIGAFPQVSAGTIDRVRIAMGERARTAGQRGANDMAGGLRDRASDIDSALGNVDGLADARASYRGFSQAIEGVEEIGPQILSAAPDQFAASVARIGPQGRQASQVGARQALVDLFGQRANAGPALRQIAFAPNARANLAELFGPEEADRYVQAARLQLKRAENAAFVAPNTGPQSFNRKADAEQFDDVIGTLAQGSKGNFVSMAVEKFRRGLTLTDKEAEALVEIGLMQPKQGLAAVRPTLSQRAGSLASAPRLSVVAPSAAAGQGVNRK